MKQDIANESSQIRSFSLIVGGVFGILGVWPFLVHGLNFRFWALVIAVGLIVPGLIYPKVLTPIYKGWMTLGGALGWFNTRLLLAIGFFLVITPIGKVMQLLGKRPLYLKFDASRGSYREIRPVRDGGHMKHQF